MVYAVLSADNFVVPPEEGADTMHAELHEQVAHAHRIVSRNGLLIFMY